MRITIAAALPGRQIVQSLEVAEGATIQSAIESSGILAQLKNVDLHQNKVGIYGKLKPLDTVLEAGDRIEIYRPLIADPKAVLKRKTPKA